MAAEKGRGLCPDTNVLIDKVQDIKDKSHITFSYIENIPVLKSREFIGYDYKPVAVPRSSHAKDPTRPSVLSQ